jgi:hypothetical protein
MVLPKNERGKQVDTMLTASIKNLRANGQLEKIMHQIDLPYSDWQP